ncbi:MAG: hypothetical protein V3T98_02330, partial [Candidatus Paceibacterota bacterium]
IISYYDYTNRALKVIHCANVSCSAFDTPTIMDSEGDVGYHTSITIGIDGLPIISYNTNLPSYLKVVHCANVSCSAFDTPTTVDSEGVSWSGISITIGIDGLPIISYHDYTNRALNVVHCANVSCSAFTSTTVDSEGDVGRYASITIGIDGLPIISYFDETNTALKVVHCANVSCSAFDMPNTVYSEGGMWSNTSITIGIDGLPIISYRDDSNDSLKVVHCANPYCIPYWTRR